MVTRSRNRHQAYNTASHEISTFMARALAVEPTNVVLEPCAGGGDLIEAILGEQSEARIEAFEIQPNLVESLREKFAHCDQVGIEESDTITSPPTPRKYDRVIANPPYGAWLDYGRRAELRSRYPELYVKESYSLFLYLALEALAAGGRGVFIIPDAFLYLHRHEWLRRKLLAECHVEDVVIFPSNFFPGVSYKYSQLCIITFVKTAAAGPNLAKKWTTVRQEIEDPVALLSGASGKVLKLEQARISENLASSFFVLGDASNAQRINTATMRIGDVADCVTGFYSGDDKRYIRCSDPTTRGARRYAQLNPATTADEISQPAPLEGISTSNHFVRIKKGGPGRYLGKEPWYIDWSTEAVTQYKQSKKSRFQNSGFYFRSGIAVPMVSSSGVRATLMNQALFDQSIVGVFPRDPSMSLLLLGYLNSRPCSDLAATINPTANLSANYLKKVPFPRVTPSASADIVALVESVLEGLRRSNDVPVSVQAELDEHFAEALDS